MAKRKSPPMEKPRARIVCDEPDSHVVVLRLSANRYRVPPHGVYEVVRAATRYTNNIERVLDLLLNAKQMPLHIEITHAMQMKGVLITRAMSAYSAKIPCWTPLTGAPNAPPWDRSVAGILTSMVLLDGNS